MRAAGCYLSVPSCGRVTPCGCETSWEYTTKAHIQRTQIPKKKVLSKVKVIAFTLLLIGFSTVQAQSSFPIEVTDQGHVLVKARINDVEGHFILDTGAGMNVLVKDFASKVNGLRKLDGVYTGFRSTGERLDLDLYSGGQVEIGGVRLEESDLSIIDINWPIDGIISLMGFRNTPFTIDFENERLYFETTESLEDRKEKGNTFSIQLEDSRGKAIDIFAYIELNGALKLQTSLDSGAGANVFRVNSRYMPMLGIDSTDVECARAQGELDPNQVNNFCRTSLEKIALHELPDVGVEDVEMTFVSGLIYDALVDIRWLGDRITIDLDRKEMVVQ